MHADLSIASISDDLFDTVDYGSLTGLVADIVAGSEGEFDAALAERPARARGWPDGRPVADRAGYCATSSGIK